MKNYVYKTLILALFVSILAPVSTSAQYYNYGYSNNSAQIAQIQAQLDSLRAQLSTLSYSGYNYNTNYYPNYTTGSVMGAYTGIPTPTSPSCNFTQDLSLGTSGTQVASLNQFLGVSAGSYFGQETYNAVVRFQNQYANEILYPAGFTNATGVVGSFTRAKLNSLCNGMSGMGSVLGATYLPAQTGNPYYTTGYNNYQTNYYPYNNYNNTFNPNSASPTVNLYSTPTSVDINQTVAIIWNTTNVSTCRAGGAWSGDKIPNSSETKVVSALNQTYSLTCTGYNGEQITRSVVVGTTGGGNGGGTPALNFYANPPVVYGGGSTTLYWSTYNSSTCVASGAWSGTKGNTGNEPVSGVAGGRTYTLSCANSNGDTTTQSVTVTSIN